MTTRSDLDARIRATASELVGAAPPAPVFPDEQALSRANRAAALTLRRHRAAVVLVAAALIAVFFVPLPHMTVGQASMLPGNGSAGGQFSFAGGSDGRLLWQTEALLATSDGVHWSVISAVPPE
ncbi:MAG: hypothetical protein ABSD85_13140 [Acidimicrobiales bacterium]|jgi:uncharacterized protein (DUF2126 family)